MFKIQACRLLLASSSFIDWISDLSNRHLSTTTSITSTYRTHWEPSNFNHAAFSNHPWHHSISTTLNSLKSFNFNHFDKSQSHPQPCFHSSVFSISNTSFMTPTRIISDNASTSFKQSISKPYHSVILPNLHPTNVCSTQEVSSKPPDTLNKAHNHRLSLGCNTFSFLFFFFFFFRYTGFGSWLDDFPGFCLDWWKRFSTIRYDTICTPGCCALYRVRSLPAAATLSIIQHDTLSSAHLDVAPFTGSGLFQLQQHCYLHTWMLRPLVGQVSSSCSNIEFRTRTRIRIRTRTRNQTTWQGGWSSRKWVLQGCIFQGSHYQSIWILKILS